MTEDKTSKPAPTEDRKRETFNGKTNSDRDRWELTEKGEKENVKALITIVRSRREEVPEGEE